MERGDQHKSNGGRISKCNRYTTMEALRDGQHATFVMEQETSQVRPKQKVNPKTYGKKGVNPIPSFVGNKRLHYRGQISHNQSAETIIDIIEALLGHN